MDEKSKAIAFATLCPGAAMVAGYGLYWADSGIRDWIQKSKKPAWFPTNENVWMACDIGSVVPAAYAAYHVFRAGGFDREETKLACAAYVATFAEAVLCFTPAMKMKDDNKTFWAMVGYGVLSTVTAGLFFRVDAKYGLMMVPLVVWSHLGVMAEMGCCCPEKKK